MFCYKCGEEIPEESEFCMKCGAKMPILDNNIQENDSADNFTNTHAKITTIPLNTTIKSTMVSSITVSNYCISYKSGLKNASVNIEDITAISYKPGNKTFNGRLFITADGKEYSVMFDYKNNEKIEQLCRQFPFYIPVEPQPAQSSYVSTSNYIINNEPQKPLSKHQRKRENKKNGVACCPKCGSTSITANKKGFGIGKAVIGASIVGPIGLVAGNKGAQKVKITCLNCGHQWKP